MSGPDWCRFYPNRWITGTVQLSLEQRGFYIQVVAAIMDLGSCEAADAYLARLCHCQIRKAARLKAELIALGKLVENDGKLFNKRATVERSLAEKLSTNGQNRAAKRWKNKDVIDAGLQCKPQPQPHKKEEGLRPNGRYRFCGTVIRVNDADFTQWAQSFRSVLLEAKLTALDAWLIEHPEKQKRWFQWTAGVLAKEHEANCKAGWRPPRGKRDVNVVMDELMNAGREYDQ